MASTWRSGKVFELKLRVAGSIPAATERKRWRHKNSLTTLFYLTTPLKKTCLILIFFYFFSILNLTFFLLLDVIWNFF